MRPFLILLCLVLAFLLASVHGRTHIDSEGDQGPPHFGQEPRHGSGALSKKLCVPSEAAGSQMVRPMECLADGLPIDLKDLCFMRLCR
jgi:hypothetical protein